MLLAQVQIQKREKKKRHKTWQNNKSKNELFQWVTFSVGNRFLFERKCFTGNEETSNLL